MKIKTVVQLADNVRRLMGSAGDTQAVLAARAGLSQRVIGDLLTYGKGHFKNPTLKTLEGVAGAYKVAPWILLIPDLPLEIVGSLQGLIENYRDAPPSGRENILRVADSEVRYAAAHKPSKKTGT